jgi:hypothetical protein
MPAWPEIRGRYGSDQDYHADLDRVGLDAHSLRRAVARDMVVEAVLESVARSADGGQRYRCRDLLVPAQGSLPTRRNARAAARSGDHQRNAGGQ